MNGNFEHSGPHSRFVLPAISLVYAKMTIFDSNSILANNFFWDLKIQDYFQFRIIFLMTSTTSGLSFHSELRRGILTRSFCAGINTVEVLIFHWIIELILMLVHVALVLVIPIFAFNIMPMNGFWPWPILLFAITGVSGLTLSE